MASRELERLFKFVDTLSETDRQALVDYLAQTQNQAGDDTEDGIYSDEDIREMMSPRPKSGREIVKQGRQSGAIGSWADKHITDPVEWLRQQRTSRFQW
jgi:hypothetical protein